MKKLLSLIVGLLLSFLAYSQSYLATSTEVINIKTGKTLRSEVCTINFMIDTANKAMTMVDISANKINVFYLIRKAPFILHSQNFYTWGYSQIKCTAPFKQLSFTYFNRGPLASINMYRDSLATVFYITDKYDL